MSTQVHTLDRSPPAASAEPWWRERALALAILLPAAIVLGLAAWFTPDPSGTGTHTQLGLAPCAMKLTTGLPCATCGMTTSFAYAAEGQFLAAFLTQPAGAILALLTAMAALLSAWALVTGMSLMPLIQQLIRPRVVVGTIVFLLVSWGYTLWQAMGT
ncbi:MAG: DUF2752 domain-containing protein [Phycisphaeraceae bacterium]